MILSITKKVNAYEQLKFKKTRVKEQQPQYLTGAFLLTVYQIIISSIQQLVEKFLKNICFITENCYNFTTINIVTVVTIL